MRIASLKCIYVPGFGEVACLSTSRADEAAEEVDHDQVFFGGVSLGGEGEYWVRGRGLEGEVTRGGTGTETRAVAREHLC